MRAKMSRPRALLTIPLLCPLALCSVLGLTVAASAQTTRPEPATDSSTQASPITPVPAAPVVDSSYQASPITPVRTGSGVHLAPHTALHLRLSTSIDSGRLKNGQTVHATLTQAVSRAPRGSLPAGTPVDLTVVETLPAGRLYSAGEFSLQVLRVGSSSVYTDTLTFRGKPGHKDLPDSAPSVGTDAGLAAGAALTFHVQAPPSTAVKPAKASGPGAVNGVSSGSAQLKNATPRGSAYPH